ncbi:hypothetical protein DAPPUDRAFT_126524, partial [Daphnia pulex]
MHGDAARSPDLGHPFTQGRDGNLAADDDQSHHGIDSPEFQQDQQRGTDQHLVSHRVQEGTKGRGLIELSGQVAIQPVGQRDQNEQRGGKQVLAVFAQVQIEHTDDQRNGDDAGPSEQGWQGIEASVQRSRLEMAVVVEQEGLAELPGFGHARDIAEGRGAMQGINGQLQGVRRLPRSAQDVDALDMTVMAQFYFQHRNRQKHGRHLPHIGHVRVGRDQPQCGLLAQLVMVAHGAGWRQASLGRIYGLGRLALARQRGGSRRCTGGSGR